MLSSRTLNDYNNYHNCFHNYVSFFLVVHSLVMPNHYVCHCLVPACPRRGARGPRKAPAPEPGPRPPAPATHYRQYIHFSHHRWNIKSESGDVSRLESHCSASGRNSLRQAHQRSLRRLLLQPSVVGCAPSHPLSPSCPPSPTQKYRFHAWVLVSSLRTPNC